MVAPSFQAKGTYLTGTAANSAVALPTGIVADELVLVGMYIESTATVTPPAGYVQEGTVAVTGVSAHTFRLFWHRATGSESGTVTFTHTSAYREVLACRFTGCVTGAGDPFDTGTGAMNTATSTTPGAATPAVSLTTTGADELLVWFATNFDGGAFTPPSGFTEQHDTGTNDMTMATLAQAVAGATGSLAGTGPALADGKTAAVAALLPAAAGSTAAPRVPLVSPGLAAIQAGSW